MTIHDGSRWPPLVSVAEAIVNQANQLYRFREAARARAEAATAEYEAARAACDGHADTSTAASCVMRTGSAKAEALAAAEAFQAADAAYYAELGQL